jgi:tripartite-type tricarboxylate transporter receptor subunit TctC
MFGRRKKAMDRREFLTLMGAATLSSGAFQSASGQQSYPSRPISFIVPFTPGGSTDILARLLGQRFQESMKATVVIDNRPGAGGSTGSAAVARAAPDGYTIGMGHIGTLAVNPSLYRNLAYDPLKSFAHIGMLAKVHNILAVHPSLPLKDVKEFIEYAKSYPGKLNYGSGGPGSAAHIATEAFALETGTQFVHVPYRGTLPAVTDLLSGQIQLMVTGAPALLPHVQNGNLRALGTASLTRLPSAKEIPTISEAGVPGFEAAQWYGVIAPAGIPDGIIAKLSAEVRLALTDQKILDALEKDGAEPWPMTPQEFREHITKEIPRWRKVVDNAKITVE